MLDASVITFIGDKIHSLPAGLVYGLVALLVFGEAAIFIGFVLPGETSVIIAGVVASQDHINIGVLCVLVVVSAILGDTVGYAIGRRYGERILTFPIIRTRHVAIERALEGLERRGPAYVFIGRFTAFLRAVMPGLAGMSKMHYRRCFWANASGALLWGIGYSLLGYFAGGALSKIEKYSSWASAALLVLVIGGLIAWHYYKKRRDARRDERWRAQHEPTDSAEDPT